jgi:hypothetical protein
MSSKEYIKSGSGLFVPIGVMLGGISLAELGVFVNLLSSTAARSARIALPATLGVWGALLGLRVLWRGPAKPSWWDLLCIWAPFTLAGLLATALVSLALAALLPGILTYVVMGMAVLALFSDFIWRATQASG